MDENTIREIEREHQQIAVGAVLPDEEDDEFA